MNYSDFLKKIYVNGWALKDFLFLIVLKKKKKECYRYWYRVTEEN